MSSINKDKNTENPTVLGRTVKELVERLDRAFEEFLLEHPDISREEALEAWTAAGAF